jgi:cytochrome c oxidase subunit III
MSQITNMNQNTNGRIHPKLFLLYLSFGSMIMLFSAFCSALIVRKGDVRQAWLEVPLPDTFLYSTLIIIVSSVTIHFAYKFIESRQKFVIWSFITLVLALVFVGLQFKGWMDLQTKQVFLSGNPAGSFIYVISWLHGLHYLGGIVALILIILNFRKKKIDESKKMGMNILMQYWHFIGLVWVLLYLFFKFIIYN